MRLESEHIHYRARFEIFPYVNTDEVGPFVLSSLCDWILGKERRRRGAGRVALICNLIERGIFDYHLEHPDAISRECRVSSDMLGGMSVPEEYDGGVVGGRTSHICTRAFSDGAASFPQYWAMDYDEPDSRYSARRWHTSVGITCRDNTCVVNVRVSNYLVPGFIGEPPEQPTSTTPKFVRELIALEGCQTCIGETILHACPIAIGEDNYQVDFFDNLVSRDRGLPMIVVCSDDEGELPVDVANLARKVTGIANVYTIDYHNPDVRKSLRRTFRQGRPSFEFRLGRSYVRIYEPNLDLGDARDATRHRFFTQQAIEESGDRLSDIIAMALTRSRYQDDADIIDVADVEAQRRRAKNELLRQRVQQLAERAASHETELEVSFRREIEARASYDELKNLLAERDEANTKLQSDIAEWQEIASSYASQVEEMAAAEQSERSKLQGQISGYEARVQGLEACNGELSEDLRRAKYQLQTANIRYNEIAAQLKDSDLALRQYEDMNHIPSSLSDIIELVEGAYPSRVTFLKEARVSALEFEGHYKLDDEWQILRSVPIVLWELYFGVKVGGDISSEYRLQTGYELALREGSTTKKDADLMRLRNRTYLGRTIQVIPHIKGRDASRSEAFRVHYNVDQENQKIVIGHCGGHMDTAGTRRRA